MTGVTLVIPVLDEERALPELVWVLGSLDPPPAEIICCGWRQWRCEP